MDEQERRRARRDFARRHHPDRGGDPETFAAGMRAFDAPAPLVDRVARSAGRLLADLRRLPDQVRDAYREGRDGG